MMLPPELLQDFQTTALPWPFQRLTPRPHPTVPPPVLPPLPDACQVASPTRCKIADLGLSKKIMDDEDYYKSRGGKVPVRWMAPESLERRR